MDSMIRTAFERHGPTLGIKLPYGCDIYPKGKRDPYFFVNVCDKKTGEETGKYRHMKVTAGSFLDYITRTYYPTFQSWVESIPNIHDAEIFFGFQRWDERNNCVSLAYVILCIQPEQRVEIPTIPLQAPPVDHELDELTTMMRQHNIGLGDIQVRGFMPAQTWLDLNR
jgi:hypothetical protein